MKLGFRTGPLDSCIRLPPWSLWPQLLAHHSSSPLILCCGHIDAWTAFLPLVSSALDWEDAGYLKALAGSGVSLAETCWPSGLEFTQTYSEWNL